MGQNADTSAVEDALAYMTGVEGRRHVLRDSSGVP